VVGTYLYLKEKRVDDIFIAQVDRIGAQLEHIKNALVEHPIIVQKQSAEPNDQDIYEERDVTLRWGPQMLRERWFTYMDGVYERASDKAQKFMTDNLKRLNDEYNDGIMVDQKDIDKEKDKTKQEEMKKEKLLREDMKKNIPLLEAAWKDHKDWPKPRWNSQVPGTPDGTPTQSSDATATPTPEATPSSTLLETLSFTLSSTPLPTPSSKSNATPTPTHAPA
jgi:hypothetical protein